MVTKHKKPSKIQKITQWRVIQVKMFKQPIAFVLLKPLSADTSEALVRNPTKILNQSCETEKEKKN